MFRPLRNTLAALLLAVSPILATIPAAEPAWAQDPGDPPADVARIAVISGSVSSHQPGSQNWDAAQQNYPLAPGSGVWTEPRSHAAVDVAGARVHLDASSQLEITAINQGQVQLSLAQGAAVIRVYPGVSGVDFEIDTAHGAAHISQPGQYEIVAGDDQNPATLSVIEGQAQFVGQSANLALQAGQRGAITPNNQSAVDAAQPDDFVRMVQGEEQPYQQQVAQTAQYVSPQQAGYQDLARYGQWDQASDYGAVWYPQTVPANWAPYRNGHWAYVAPWGWTWVDDAPWGFTPFHYGRWVEIRHRWAWVPGRRVERPVYAPALVSFFDLGGVGVKLSLGWVPLAPEEVYVPTYRHSQRYVREVNITNVRNETTIVNVVNKKTVINVNNYKNYRGATSASRDAMEHDRPVGPDWNKNDRSKFDQQWAHAKPDQEVAFKPQGKAEQGKGPKFEPRQHQNWQPNAKPDGKPNQPKVPESQVQTGKSLNKNDRPNPKQNPMPQAQSEKTSKPNGKVNMPNPPQAQAAGAKPGQPKIPAPQAQPEKTWTNNGKPISKDRKPQNGAPQPFMPPADGAAQKFDKPQAPTPVNGPVVPKPSGSKKSAPLPVITPAAAPRPEVEPHRQEQTSKTQWKAQPQSAPQPREQTAKQQRKPEAQSKQGGQPNPNPRSEKAAKGDQAPAQQQQKQQQNQKQQQKPAQNCGQQQAGACH